MIRFSLACDRGHDSEAWFPSGSSADDQLARGLVECPVCGSARVSKALMAPALSGTKRSPREAEPAPAPAAVPAPVETPAAPFAMVDPRRAELTAALKELRSKLLENSENVGDRFADEARKIHFGETEARTIHGKATPEEARALREDGVEFGPLPIVPDEMN